MASRLPERLARSGGGDTRVEALQFEGAVGHVAHHRKHVVHTVHGREGFRVQTLRASIVLVAIHGVRLAFDRFGVPLIRRGGLFLRGIYPWIGPMA
eukprot:272301-Prorocentrum_minimum.AAC.1